MNIPTQNAILDTTGSVIYTSEDVQEKFLSNWYIVHISASSRDVEHLKIRYFDNPKPLIWNGHYVRRSDQTEDEAILTSYPELLASRAKAYTALADATIGSDVILNPKNSIEDIFEALKPPV